MRSRSSKLVKSSLRTPWASPRTPSALQRKTELVTRAIQCLSQRSRGRIMFRGFSVYRLVGYGSSGAPRGVLACPSSAACGDEPPDEAGRYLYTFRHSTRTQMGNSPGLGLPCSQECNRRYYRVGRQDRYPDRCHCIQRRRFLHCTVVLPGKCLGHLSRRHQRIPQYRHRLSDRADHEDMFPANSHRGHSQQHTYHWCRVRLPGMSLDPHRRTLPGIGRSRRFASAGMFPVRHRCNRERRRSRHCRPGQRDSFPGQGRRCSQPGPHTGR